MSLLDDVSIVVTPNGYKAGELYAVVPVPTEGSEMLSQPVDLQTDFTAVNGASIVDANTFTTTGGSVEGLTKAAILTVGTQYKLIIEGTTTSSGFSLGNTTAGGNEYGSGFGTHYFTASGNNTLWLRQSTAGTTDITSFSIKEYTSADMDVTRATAATRVDENGLVNYAEIVTGSDIVTDGDFPDGSTAWSLNGWTISGNTANGNGLTANLIQSISGSANKNFSLTFTISNYISGRVIPAFVGNSSDSLEYSSNGTFTEVISSGSDIRFVFYGSSFSGSISNVSLKEVTRDNVPRIDYTGGGCPHILAEPQRTNLITYSEDFSQSYWTKQSGVTPTYNTTETLSPDGTYNATKFIGNGSSGVLKGGISVTGVIARSVYLKSITGTVNVVLKDPNLTVTQKTLTVTEEWQRFELIESNGTSTQGIWIDDIPVSGIYIWGAQLEEGSYATSYIPTSGSTVTRNQDIFTRDGIGSLINSTEGVLFVEMAALADDLTYREISLSDGTSTNRIEIRYTTNSNRIQVLIRNGSYLALQYDVSSIVDFNKVAFKWKTGDFALWVNGVERATDSTTFVTSGLNRLAFDQSPSGNEFFGKVKQLQVYNTALTDEQLLQLTGTSGTDFYESYAEMASALTYTIQ